MYSSKDRRVFSYAIAGLMLYTSSYTFEKDSICKVRLICNKRTQNKIRLHCSCGDMLFICSCLLSGGEYDRVYVVVALLSNYVPVGGGGGGGEVRTAAVQRTVKK